MSASIIVDAPSTEEFADLQAHVTDLLARVAALESASAGGGSSVLTYRAGWDAKIERVTEIPVATSGTYWTNLASMVIPGPFKAGDSIDLSFELHGTNDDLRARGYGVAWVTQAYLSPDETDDRNGYALNWANGSYNVGVEAHHGMVSRRGAHVFTADEPGPLYFKVVSHAKSTAAIAGDKFLIDQWRGVLLGFHHSL